MKTIAVLSDESENKVHLNALSRALQMAGVENEMRFVSVTREELSSAIASLRAEGISCFRFDGSLPEVVPSCFDNLPATILTIKAADALILENDGKLWPRNYIQEGLQHLVAADVPNLDLSGGAFLVGATAEMRGIVAALVRIGFRKLNLTELDEQKGKAFIEELKKTYFNIQFQFTPRNLVTQLPGVHSIAVNTIEIHEDPNRLTELFYFNFLKSGALWIETPCRGDNSALIQEARNVGADVRTGAQLVSRWDDAWAEACFKVKLDLAFMRSELDRRLGLSTNS